MTEIIMKKWKKEEEESQLLEGIYEEKKSILNGFNVALMGASGTGKTHSIGTLVDTGLEVFYLSLENGLESLIGYYTDKGMEIPENLHWHRVEPKKASFTAALSNANKILTMDQKTLASTSDVYKKEYDQWIKIIKSLQNFHDDRTDKDYGAVDEWDTSRILVIDGLTGLSKAAMHLVIGGKAMRSQSDWGIAQGQVDTLLTMLTEDCPCHFVLIAHIDREMDEVLGGVKFMMSSLGKALYPKLPVMFSDIILTVRDGTNWYWDTLNSQADIKTRNLPMISKGKPDFHQIVDKWKSRNQS